MVFLLNYVYSITCTYLLGREYAHVKLSNNALLFLLLPVFLIWLIISGGQDSVGTDYESYIYIFEGNQLDYYIKKNELLFAAIISLFNKCGMHGQALFYVFYAINFIFFFLILKRLPLKQVFLYILLYITVTNLFNNQLNTLRQTTAIYIGTYAAFLIFENKNIKALLFILIASLIHQSGLILLFLYVLKYISKIQSSRFFLICLCGAFVLSLLLQVNSINLIVNILPDDYAWYVARDRLEERDFLNKLTKYAFIPIYIMSLSCLHKNYLTAKENVLFKCGWIAFCLRLSFINLMLVSRVVDYFLLLSILPLTFYLYNLFESRKHFLFVSIVFCLSIFYALKVTIFAQAEYLYDSIYF